MRFGHASDGIRSPIRKQALGPEAPRFAKQGKEEPIFLVYFVQQCGLEFRIGNQQENMKSQFQIEWFRYLEKVPTVDTILVEIKEILLFGMFHLRKQFSKKLGTVKYPHPIN